MVGYNTIILDEDLLDATFIKSSGIILCKDENGKSTKIQLLKTVPYIIP